MAVQHWPKGLAPCALLYTTLLEGQDVSPREGIRKPSHSLVNLPCCQVTGNRGMGSRPPHRVHPRRVGHPRGQDCSPRARPAMGVLHRPVTRGWHWSERKKWMFANC